MVQLGRHFGTGPASLAEIAAEEDLPRAYLEQLVISLRDAGLVASTRGAHGGYELTRAPHEIRMGEVLRALEGPIAPMICATDDPEHGLICDRSSRCTVNVLWVRVRDAVTGALDGTRSARVMLASAPVIASRMRTHSRLTVQLDVRSQRRPCSGSSVAQTIGAMGPSSARRTSTIGVSSGGRASW